MNRFKNTPPALIAVVIVVLVALWLASGLFKSDNQPADSTDQGNTATTTGNGSERTPVIRVQTQLSDASPMMRNASVSARTAPLRSVNLRAETSGKVTEVVAERGAQVNAGDVIARLEIGDRRSRLTRAEAINEQRRLQYEAAKKMHARGHISDLDIATRKADHAAARAELAQARDDLEHTVIRAPMSGVLEKRPVEMGDFVSVGDLVAQVVQQRPFLVRGYVTEKVIGRIQPGQTGQVTLLDGSAMEGQVRYAASVADEKTRTFLVELEVDPGEKSVIAGASAVLSIPLEEVMAHEVLPSTLTLNETGEFGIKSVSNDNSVTFHSADIVQNRDGRVWLANLPERLRVITVGQNFVNAGDLVEIETDANTNPNTIIQP